MNDALAAVPMNDLSRGIARDEHLLLDATKAVLNSGYVIQGPQHAQFERELADYLGVSHAIGLASGTDALELAIKAAMPDGRTTIMTAANAGGYATTAARRAGFSVIFADVDEVSLCLSARSVEASLTPNVGVVVVTHLYGNLTDLDAVLAACNKRGVVLVEDCAQALGARRGNRMAGRFGAIGATSFYPTKNLGALGDGGAIATDDPILAEVVRSLRQYGWSSKYHVEMAGGVNSRLDELQAAYLRVRLPQLDAFNERRRSIVAKYRDAASSLPSRLIDVLPADGEHHVAHLAVARSRERERVRTHLREHGVHTEVHYPVPDNVQRGFGGDRASYLPVTAAAVGEVFSLPCFPEMTNDEIDRVCRAIEVLQ